jgi:hypothetical protein
MAAHTRLLDALARGAAPGASAAARRRAQEAAQTLSDLARGGGADCAALVADAGVAPALAAVICSRHADGAVVGEAACTAADLTGHCPAAARRELQDALVRLGALEASVQRLSLGGFCGGTAARLVGALVEDRPGDIAVAAIAAGALPGLVALTGDADDAAAAEAAEALGWVAGRARSPTIPAVVEAGAVRAHVARLARPGVSDASLRSALRQLAALASTPAGEERLVADGALPHVARLLLSPVLDVSEAAVRCLTFAAFDQAWGVVAEALLGAAAAAAAALARLLLGPDRDTQFRAAGVLNRLLWWGHLQGSPEAVRLAGGLASAVRRPGVVPRLVELLRAALDAEEEQRRGFARYGMSHLSSLICARRTRLRRERRSAPARGRRRAVFSCSMSLARTAPTHCC